MMSYDEWLGRILDAARDIASREFQQEAWFAGGKVVSSPSELFLTLMEDYTADLFFETYGQRFTETQLQSWHQLRSNLTKYYDQLPSHPDPSQVFHDPGWDLVRQSAERFVRAFGR